MSYDELMNLLVQLYDNMDELDKAMWSLEAAQEMVDDQHTYERQYGLPEGEYDTRFWYDAIADMIEADAEEEEDEIQE